MKILIILLIILALFVYGLIALYSFLKQLFSWKNLGGQDVDVISNTAINGIFKSKSSFNSKLRLLDDKIIFRILFLNPILMLEGQFPSVYLKQITSVKFESYSTLSFKTLLIEIHTSQKNKYYQIYCNEDSFNKIIFYLKQKNVSVVATHLTPNFTHS